MLPVFAMLGEADDTFTLTSTDAAQSLSASVLTVAGKSCKALMLTVETQPVKIAMGGAIPISGAGALGHVIQKDSTPVYIVGTYAVSTFKYISAVGGSAGKIQVTPFY